MLSDFKYFKSLHKNSCYDPNSNSGKGYALVYAMYTI